MSGPAPAASAAAPASGPASGPKGMLNTLTSLIPGMSGGAQARNRRGRFLSTRKAKKAAKRAASRKGTRRATSRKAGRAVGTKAQVWHGTADHTSGGLRKGDLMKTKKGRIVSRKKHASGLRALARLRKAGYKAKKGTFRLFKRG